MADFTKKKLQVFVSSTYTDLHAERQAAVSAILTAGHIPAGMELFTAGDESQMEVIKQWIDESDVYLLILGGRYGSIESKSGKSYTHLEYEYAVEKGKPLFSCVITPKGLDSKIEAEKTKVIEMDNQAKLKEFKETVTSKMCKFWEDSKDIKIAVTESLATFARRDNLTGWVRANNQANLPMMASEIARLSQENAELRAVGRAVEEPMPNGLTFSEAQLVLERKGLIVYLKTNREALTEGHHMQFNTFLRELQLLGFVDLIANSVYRGNSTCLIFLNKLEAYEIIEKANQKIKCEEVSP